ncbi:sensor histidine kinase [Altererythrobacter sp. KTW20L]|uniref:sensor histidine kinase n=1 Tax=Altererythrobacter sp. KTW20L TaxID=2942210 RepID=UPI0020C1163F|nr:sensor histidine kinase [Altererythrobacter sp. KTW20L]MCL6250849.1 sensor histidine kinase [Altererythrobacter sp. KTW20L]
MDWLIERFPVLKRAILADHPFHSALGWSALAVLVPLALRLAIDGGTSGVPFTTFFPAVLLVALLLGWRWGAVVTLASGIAANRILMYEPLDVLAPVDLLLVGLFFLSCAVLLATAEFARRLVRQVEAAKAREEMLKYELLHRVKNMLATVGAIAAMTSRHSPPDQYRTALTGRLEALQRATSLLGTEAGQLKSLAKVLESSLAPFRAADNFVLEGPACQLPSRSCVPLSLALHELCTNASKYGALSASEGRVEISWRIDPAKHHLQLEWRERGGPQVQTPTRQGMGSQLLRRQPELTEVTLDFAPDGLVCHLTVRDVSPQS